MTQERMNKILMIYRHCDLSRKEGERYQLIANSLESFEGSEGSDGWLVQMVSWFRWFRVVRKAQIAQCQGYLSRVEVSSKVQTF